MMRYIKTYPFSLLVILLVIYLSFFRPPSTELDTISGFDKVVHLCMYAGMSGVLWVEFIRSCRVRRAPLWHAWIGAFVCPVLFSGAIELLQEYATDHRSGDWWDFAANSAGALLASCFFYLWSRKRGCLQR